MFLQSTNDLKKRLVAVLTIKNGIVVQSINFKRYLPIGKPEIAIEFLNKWGIDEIILLDLDATYKKSGPDFELIKYVSKKCFVPLTVGGGINDLQKMRELIKKGADKISINTVAIKNPTIIKEAANILGNQCIVVSIDVKKNESNNYEIYLNSGKNKTGIDPFQFAKQAEELGAGEILINSIDKDGSKEGYDIELIDKISKIVSIPVIACGGVGYPKHIIEGINKTNASAFAAGNYFHFTEHSVITTKAYLKLSEISKKQKFRLDSNSNYEKFSFDENGRVNRKDDQYLDQIRFEYEKEEEI